MPPTPGDGTTEPGSAVGRLGDAAAAAETALAVSRDPAPATDPAAAPADPAAAPADPAAPAADPAKAAEGEKKEGDGEKKPEGAPEKYEDFKLPEGVKADDAALAEVLPVFKEAGLTQAQAQKFVDFYAKQAAASATKALENWNAHLEATTAAAKADKEVGGANWDQSLGYAKAFLTAFGSPKLQEYLNTAEAGSHVEIIRAFAKAGKAISEDGFVPGQATAQAPKSAASLLYPTMKQ